MNEHIWSEFWWENITGAKVVASEVVDALINNKIAVLRIPSDLPWRHAMRSEIHTEFQEKETSDDIVIKPIDATDDNKENLEPGKFILKQVMRQTEGIGYREKSGIKIQDYIIQKGILKNCILWVKGISKESADEWIKFCRYYMSKGVEDGLFVLEIRNDIAITKSDNIALIDYYLSVSDYDVQLLNSFILDDMKTYSDTWKRYIATLSALLCKDDAEISELLIRIIDFHKDDPIGGIKRIAEMQEYIRRGAENNSKHVLSLYRQGNIDELGHRIWSAQVKVLFPLIELERVSIIHKYETAIKKTLDENEIEQYGEIIKNPIDVELGTLDYLINHRKFYDEYLLYLPNENDRNRINFLHKCRNILAHANCCSPSEINTLLQ
jgi:hypothetical protein